MKLFNVSGVATMAILVGFAAAPVADGFAFSSPRIAGPNAFGSATIGSGKSPVMTLATSLSAMGDDKATESSKSAEPTLKKKKKTWKELRQEGGLLTINTPIGALNPFAVYYFIVSVGLGLPWLFFLKLTQIFYWVTGYRFDTKVRTDSRGLSIRVLLGMASDIYPKQNTFISAVTFLYETLFDRSSYCSLSTSQNLLLIIFHFPFLSHRDVSLFSSRTAGE